jgi:hypothetical protein
LAYGLECGSAKATGTCREIHALEPAFLPFAAGAGVEPTNNTAERALRGWLLSQKGRYVTDDAGASHFVDSILAASANCRQQGQDVLSFVTGCCEALRQKLALLSYRAIGRLSQFQPVAYASSNEAQTSWRRRASAAGSTRGRTLSGCPRQADHILSKSPRLCRHSVTGPLKAAIS